MTDIHSPMDIEQMTSLKHWGEPPENGQELLAKPASVDCGWGRLLFGQTFADPEALARSLLEEQPGQRDMALYCRDPQVVVSFAPQRLFIDPSLTYRLDLTQQPIDATPPKGISIRPLTGSWDEYEMNRLYKARQMVPLREKFTHHQLTEPALTVLMAIDDHSQTVVGCVTGVDHPRLFDDPDQGASLWALAVDPQCALPGVGAALVQALASHFQQRQRRFLDLSVMHDNQQALALYHKLGFRQVPVYCVKTRNAINEQLYIGDGDDKVPDLNIYAQIIVDEAYRRGIGVQIEDPALGLFTLSLGGRSVNCRESLTDLTSAIAMTRCDNKDLTHRLLAKAGLKVPTQKTINNASEAIAFWRQHGPMVLKPARGEQGNGVFVDLRNEQAIHDAYQQASALEGPLLAEQYIEGQDLRILVIGDEVVAAAVRKPPTIVGDGLTSIGTLIDKLSRRRAAATSGESRIPLDSETQRCVADAGFEMSDILPYGRALAVRKTANLHTGGSLNDVTTKLHPRLREVALHAARVLAIPVTGLDLLVHDPSEPDYVIIEANERPGLANHEPHPTVERFLDLLFPQTQGGR
ncbi:GNAT-family acetyltransferase TIGR03103 [Ferrimonas balearica DSM 9799]|uniref:GNAT-family acetyltransferase TIGR03103 n=1 Tax=Ferrimonas balearica (strain DSM 9799 / CCM 4581 / KCTC 23876 / PAT) TaxID=550540 RepID=E1SL49_FERBD|nr:N-acetylglutaminylglutamine synthetase [Ferrimonas balearica]ADN75427.1 GNAT-family acetyltransferase TIGR03103 [Ferrimonas balearica DSM 9799]